MDTTPYDLLGGEAGVRRLAEAFYDAMDELPEATSLRAMHAADLKGITEKLCDFLSGWLGGPTIYFEKHPGNCIMSMHAPYAIGPAERDRWMLCVREGLRRVEASAELAALLDQPFPRFTEALRNRGGRGLAVDEATDAHTGSGSAPA